MQDNHSGDKRSPNNREGPAVRLRADRIGLQFILRRAYSLCSIT